MLEVLDRIHWDQQQRGRKAMTEDEMEQEIAQARREADGDEERWREIWSQTAPRSESTDSA
jgi:hypothetical protein